ncbi:MAG: NUDIX hydrolase [Planctomycetes bacterium]|nr:NUDIX hydrolase [Planctomycetota bacterium]
MALRRRPDIEILGSSVVHTGPIFQVVRERLRLPSGLEQDVEVVVHSGAVAIAALDEQGRLALVRQYRHAAGDWLVEIPAGRVEVGEDRLVAAKRELEEETGLRARRWSLLREFFAAPGFCSEWLSLYLAEELERVQTGRLAHDADEELEASFAAPADVLRDSRDAKTLVAAALVSARAPRGS